MAQLSYFVQTGSQRSCTAVLSLGQKCLDKVGNEKMSYRFP